MKTNNLDFIDFESVNTLLEGFNQTTGFVTAILDLDGNVLSKSGWRQICSEFHRINPETARNCTISDTALANKMREGEKYHFYRCLNGLVDVAVPIVIKGEHIANLFSGQFFFEKPDISYFREQARKFGFEESSYLKAMERVPVVSKEKVKTAMDFLLNMTQLISEITYQKLEQIEQIEARKKSEAALKESEEKYHSFFDNSMDAILLTEPDGAIIAANSSACNLFGRTENEIRLLGRKCIVDLADPRLPVLLAKREETGKAKGELVFLHKDGTRFPGEITSAIFIDAEGKRKTSMIIRDITERKQAELALKESNELFSKAFQVGPAGMTITRISDGKFINANESFCKMFEFDPDEVIGHTSTELKMWSPEERKKMIQKQIESGGLNSFELVALTKSGKPVNILFSSKEMKIKGEECHLTTLIDISDLKRTDEQLKRAEARYKLMFENATFGIVICQLIRDETGKAIDYLHLQVNESLNRHVGVLPKDVLGKSGSEVISKEETVFLVEKFKTVVETGIPFEYQQYLATFDKTIDMQIIFIEDDYFSVVFFDVTEQKKAEEKIIKMNEELELKVIQRTSQLEAANKELEAFTYSVSHDLKAPLRGIDGYSKLLQDIYKSSLNKEAQAFIETIRSSAFRMNQLIDDLLEYSRLERTRVRLEKVKVRDMIASIVSIYREELESGKFVVNIEAGEAELMTDPKGLTIAIRNLLENAIKFTKGQPSPVINISVIQKTGSWVLSVNDNGIGFDMKYHHKIYEIFQRLQRAEDFPGTGIGLAMVNKAMQRMNGKTWAESTPGKGSTFYLELPKT